jgi:hypothetical protein
MAENVYTAARGTSLIRFTPRLCITMALIAIGTVAGICFELSAKRNINGAFATGARTATMSERPEVELITATRDGFIPGKIKRAPGKFLLVVDDRTGQPETFLRLERVAKNESTIRLRDANVTRTRPNWTEEQNLPTGDYLLTETNHPAWKCKLTITD